MSKKILLFVVAIATIAAISSWSFSGKENDKKDIETEISATLSGAAFVTTNLEASVAFYTNFLGFVERKRIFLDTPAGLSVFGVKGDRKLEYVALVPAAFSKENPNFPGLNFVEITDAKETPFQQDGKRVPIAGEIVKAYSVKGLEKIEKNMREAGVPIVTPISLSATGKSQILTVIDPNGVRVQMYEYIKK